MTDRPDAGRWATQKPRRIPPELASDERLEECTMLAAALLYRIIPAADDQGRMPGSAKSVRGMTFPMRDDVTAAKVERALDELAGAGFLVRYSVDGRAFLQVARWWDMQGAWARRSYPSRYPAPPGWEDKVFGIAGKDADSVPTDGEQPVSTLPPPNTYTSTDTYSNPSTSSDTSPGSLGVSPRKSHGLAVAPSRARGADVASNGSTPGTRDGGESNKREPAAEVGAMGFDQFVASLGAIGTGREFAAAQALQSYGRGLDGLTPSELGDLYRTLETLFPAVAR
jgi:hypothetical protein